MSGLVERLKLAASRCRCGGDPAGVRKTCPHYSRCTANADAIAEIERLTAALAAARNDALEKAAAIAENRADDYTASARRAASRATTIRLATAINDKAGCAQAIADTIRSLKGGDA